jgi:GcrA cell cycle regulator
MAMRADFWTKERITTLKQLWAEGRSAAAIAKELSGELSGVSRGAVLGKIFRLRLGAAEKLTKKRGQRAKSAIQRSRRVSPKDRPARRRAAKPNAAVAMPCRSKRKSLLELTNQCCRWPHGEPGARNFFFCGAAGADVENGLPYCPQHMRRAYIVPPERSGASHLPASLRITSLTLWRVVSRAA